MAVGGPAQTLDREKRYYLATAPPYRIAVRLDEKAVNTAYNYAGVAQRQTNLKYAYSFDFW